MGNYLPMSCKNIQIGHFYLCQYIPDCANLLLDKLLANHGPKCTHYIVKINQNRRKKENNSIKGCDNCSGSKKSMLTIYFCKMYNFNR